MRTEILLFTSVIAACATGDDGDGDPRDVLASPQRAAIATGECKTGVVASIRRPDGVHAGEASPLVKDGHVVVHVDRGPDGDDRLVLDELRLAYRDIVLPTAYFHDGQVLTGIVVALEQPLAMRARRTDDGALWGSTTADVRLDWNLRVDGETAALSPQTLRALDLELVVSGQDGALRADLVAFRDGVMWSWAGDVLTLGDAELIATAYSGID